MKVGETCEVAIQPRYAFGDAASKQPLAVVPPQATVIYTVELVSMTKVRLSHKIKSVGSRAYIFQGHVR